jgi:hypothetical protein
LKTEIKFPVVLFTAGKKKSSSMVKKIHTKAHTHLRHQITLTKQYFDELSVNESETYGLNFP